MSQRSSDGEALESRSTLEALVQCADAWDAYCGSRYCVGALTESVVTDYETAADLLVEKRLWPGRHQVLVAGLDQTDWVAVGKNAFPVSCISTLAAVINSRLTCPDTRNEDAPPGKRIADLFTEILYDPVQFWMSRLAEDAENRTLTAAKAEFDRLCGQVTGTPEEWKQREQIYKELADEEWKLLKGSPKDLLAGRYNSTNSELMDEVRFSRSQISSIRKRFEQLIKMNSTAAGCSASVDPLHFWMHFIGSSLLPRNDRNSVAPRVASEISSTLPHIIRTSERLCALIVTGIINRNRRERTAARVAILKEEWERTKRDLRDGQAWRTLFDELQDKFGSGRDFLIDLFGTPEKGTDFSRSGIQKFQQAYLEEFATRIVCGMINPPIGFLDPSNGLSAVDFFWHCVAGNLREIEPDSTEARFHENGAWTLEKPIRSAMTFLLTMSTRASQNDHAEKARHIKESATNPQPSSVPQRSGLPGPVAPFSAQPKRRGRPPTDEHTARDQQIVAANLARAYKSSGLTYQKIAENLGCSAEAVSDHLNGRNGAWLYLRKYSVLFDVTMELLLAGTSSAARSRVPKVEAKQEAK